MNAKRLLAEFGQDIRFGARLIGRSPGFTLAATASLAIGIGVSAFLFTNLQSTVFREVPGVRGARELVRLQTPIPYANFEEFRERSSQFESLAAFAGPVPFVAGEPGSRPERLWGHLASPEYFSVLGVQAQAGRLFGRDEQRPGGMGVTVIGARLAQTRFGGPSAAVGRTLRINGQALTVIGVTPEGFLGAAPFVASADLWVPTTAPPSAAPELMRLRDRTPSFDLIGRLRSGHTYRQAEAELEAMTRQLEQIHNDPGKDRKEPRIRLLPGGRLFPVRDEDMPAALGLPIVLAVLVLVMACGNVANMLIARGTARRREVAIRLSVGASRGRLVRQLLAESCLLALLGGAAGLLLAGQMMSFYESLRPMLPGYIYLDFSFDWRAVAMAAFISIVAAVGVGLLPALQVTGLDISAALKGSGLSGPSKLRRLGLLSLRNVVVANQVVTSMVLILLTGFIAVGFSRSSAVDLGFDTRNLYLLSVDPVRDGYGETAAALQIERLREKLKQVQGVAAVSLAQTLPVAFTSGESITAAKVEVVGGPRSISSLRSDHVGDGFFETAGIPLLRGRGFTTRDVASRARVMVVNETMARQVWPNTEPVGQLVDFEEHMHEVIGVARDIRSAIALRPTLPAVYQPASPVDFAIPSKNGATVLVRVQPGFDAATRLRQEVENTTPNITLLDLRKMDDIAGESLYFARLAVNIYGAVGIFALLLACTGLAGVTAYTVARRAREIGIRMALGARRRHVYRLVLKESALLIAIGCLVGMGLALALMRILSSILTAVAESTQTSMSDPLLLVGAPLLLAGLALLVCCIPARQATHVDPASILKAE